MFRLTSLRLFTLALVLYISGCEESQPPISDVQPFTASQHAGVWQSQGYGYVMVATPDSVRAYHLAGGVCVEQPDDELSLLDFLDQYRSGEDGQVLYLSSVLDPFEYVFRRVRSLPSPCLTPAANTPIGNFDALAAYFRQHYAFFELYGVNWDERVALARSTITGDISEQAMFETMADLLRPLKDSHIQIDAEIDGQSFVYDGNPGKTDLAVAAWGERNKMNTSKAIGLFRRGYWIDDIRDTLLKGEGEITANGRIQYGVLAENVGYIAFVSMGGFINGEVDTIHEERAALEATMSDALDLFAKRDVKAVIVDLSLNIGGYDFIGLDIAGRFADERTLAFTRRAGDDPQAEDFALYVEPFAGLQFTGPVYVLTSDLTVSAGEILTLSLRALGNVTHAGERTRGAFSTVLTKYLPNGWEISLSNEVYTDPHGVVWEGRGIEPGVDIFVFDANEPVEGHVEAVKAIIDLIDERD